MLLDFQLCNDEGTYINPDLIVSVQPAPREGSFRCIITMVDGSKFFSPHQPGRIAYWVNDPEKEGS